MEYSPVILDAIQGHALPLSRPVRTEWRAWGKKLVDHDNVIENWPGKAATRLIPVQSSKIGDLVADDYRAILLAILEENEERRLFVGKRPEGMCFAHIQVFCALIYILIQVRIGSSKDSTANVSLVLCLSGSTVCNHTPPLHPNQPQDPLTFRCVLAPVPMTSDTSNWPISLLPVRYVPSPFIESGRVFRLLYQSSPL